MTFAQYMEQALYGPEGYYNTARGRSGKSGDYFTAPDVGPLFGRLLATLFLRWQTLLGARPFHLIEAGAGDGALAADIGAALREFAPQQAGDFPYSAVERSASRRTILETRQDHFSAPFTVESDLEPLCARPVDGCIFANELIDAFPVHRVRIHQGRLEEAYVESTNGSRHLVWREPSTPELSERFQRLRIELPEGYETEACLEMKPWLAAAAARLRKGLLVLMDYGRPAADYYAPERNRGTLRSFHRHRVGDAWLSADGAMDLTADVEFTTLALDAQAAGWEILAFMDMGTFLLEPAEALFGRRSPNAREAASLRQLLHPDAMGCAFQVLIAGKGLPHPSPVVFPHNRMGRLGLKEILPC